jgi:hypothetical protein
MHTVIFAASQMNKVPGQFWKPKPDLMTYLTQAFQLLNPQPVPTPMAWLLSLCSKAVGGILLVTQLYAPDGTSSEPYIMVVAAPALLATFGLVDATNLPPGSSYLDFWDNMVLSLFGLPAGSALHCPFMVAAEGVTWEVKLPGIMDFMEDSLPLLFPHGEQAAFSIQPEQELHYQAFYLPEAYSMPLGLVWPTTMGYEDFLASIQPSLRSSHPGAQAQTFLIVPVNSLEPSPFITPSTYFLQAYDKGFPAVKTGEFPNLIMDPQAFSPLQEMLHGYIWRLT